MEGGGGCCVFAHNLHQCSDSRLWTVNTEPGAWNTKCSFILKVKGSGELGALGAVQRQEGESGKCWVTGGPKVASPRLHSLDLEQGDAIHESFHKKLKL